MRACLAVVAASIVACGERRDAAPCTDGLGRCVDRETFAECRGGDPKGLVVACRGPAGCRGDGPFLRDACDSSGNREGDRCIGPRWPERCADATAIYACIDQRFEEQFVGRVAKVPCRGPAGCRAGRCDKTIVRAGEPCDFADGGCSEDGSAMLDCKDGRFAIAARCRGPRGCKVTVNADASKSIDCSNDLGEVGDECAHEGLTACRLDGKAELVCTNGRLVFKQTCTCTVEQHGDGWTSKTCSG